MDGHQGPPRATMPTKTIGSMKQGTQYIERSAVRVVVTSADGERVAIIKATKGNYYKLPGGGVEGQEDHQKAAEREVFEETGAQVSVEGGCFATVEEFRNDLHQISYCYRGRLLDATGKPELTEDEMADGLSHEWVPVGEALEAMSSLEPTSELGRYIKERDMFLLAEALKFA